MSITLMTAAFRTSLPTVQKFVLVALCDNANDQGECYPSIASLMGRCSLTDRAVQKALVELESAAFIKREFRTGRATNYQIADPRTWFTPERRSPPNDVHHSPERRSPTPPNDVHPTPERGSPITIIEPSVEPSVNQEQGAHSAPKPAKGSRLPADWSLPTDWRSDATAVGVPDGLVAVEADKFRDYWSAKAGKDAAKLDWRATWRNWCRNAAERYARSPPGGRGNPSKHDLSRMNYTAGVSPDGRF